MDAMRGPAVAPAHESRILDVGNHGLVGAERSDRLSGADGKVALRDRDRDGVPIAAGGRGRRGTDGQRGGRRSRKYKYDSASCEA
jgi:hypothetical protein